MGSIDLHHSCFHRSCSAILRNSPLQFRTYGQRSQLALNYAGFFKSHQIELGWHTQRKQSSQFMNSLTYVTDFLRAPSSILLNCIGEFQTGVLSDCAICCTEVSYLESNFWYLMSMLSPPISFAFAKCLSMISVTSKRVPEAAAISIPCLQSFLARSIWKSGRFGGTGA